ncbi:5'-nucleotidase [Penaeus vannamei]|uniref:5'-nucleotidase n=1 Tax=Penaeus vannamei TaxID=6689 RepID=A0A3R7LQW8_PENVA|nr:5'-nucleotidase [Penaeus vannamei]
MYQGRDGYQMLTECPIVQDEEQCPMLSTAVQNHFTAIKTRLGKSRRNSTHRQSLVLLSRRHSLIRHDDELPAAARPSSRSSIGRSMSTDSALSTASSGSVPSVSGRRSRGSLSRQESVHELEDMACKLAPKVDGRILVATDEGLIQHLRTQKALQFGIQEEEREA